MSSVPKSLKITVTKEPRAIADNTSEPSKANTTTDNNPEKLGQDKNLDTNMLLPPRTPPYKTGAKKEPGTEDEACEEAIASGDTTPSWEGVWRKDRRDVQHSGPGGAS